jgi:hypothetical protein
VVHYFEELNKIYESYSFEDEIHKFREIQLLVADNARVKENYNQEKDNQDMKDIRNKPYKFKK